MVSADDSMAFDGLNLLRAEWLRPAEKISPLAGVLQTPVAGALQVEAGAATFLVEFHPDVDPSEARALVRELNLSIREHPDLLPNHLLVEGRPERVFEMAEWDEVAYIFPASPELAAGLRVQPCGGAATVVGVIGQYVARVGDGWDGPGKGAAQLGYYLGTLAGSVPRDAAQAEILRALGEWARSASVSFAPAASAQANKTVSILFGSRGHGDPYPFDGRGRVLAHTFYPAPPNPEPVAGDMHFDDDEPWSTIGDGIDLFSVALHEAGHALGLGHSDNPGTVMYPYYRRVSGLTEEDIAAVRELYAAPAGQKPAGQPDPKPETPAEPQTPTGPTTPTSPAPVLTITAPQPEYVSQQATIQLTGTAEHADGIARVSWRNSRGGAGQAAGTRFWSAAVLLAPGSNVLTVTAYSAGGAAASRSVTVVFSTGADNESPKVTIVSPAGTSILTYDSTITMRGMATDHSGVVEVTWSDTLGNTGTAQGTSYWTTGAIPLREGTNTITVRARDSWGNTGWRSVTITRKKR